jgi:F-type H+-transporting ATPase subunit delta
MSGNVDTVAKVYAQALYEACDATSSVAAAWEELSFLSTLWEKEKDFRLLMDNPSVDKSDKQNVIDKTFKDLEQPLVKNFLGVLVKKGRIGHLQQIAKAFEALVNEKSGMAIAYVETAASLDEASKKILIDKLTSRFSKKMILQEVLKPELLGGFIVRVGDTVIDGSVKRNVSELAKILSAVGTSDNVWETK